MILAAIYSVFDGVELLGPSIKTIINDIDMVIIVSQRLSNYGEKLKTDPVLLMDWNLPDGVLNVIPYHPDLNKSPRWNETKKRNLGLFFAKKWGASHFLHMDCDEFHPDFARAKQEFIDSGADGSVCKMFTYFKSPTLRLEKEDNYYVPFIHKLHDNTTAGKGHYPFYVDPTRKINSANVVELSHRMHHFSWVRENIDQKIRNSTARPNIEKSKLLEDYNNPNLRGGYYLEDYRQELVEVEDQFNLTGVVNNT